MPCFTAALSFGYALTPLTVSGEVLGDVVATRGGWAEGGRGAGGAVSMREAAVFVAVSVEAVGVVGVSSWAPAVLLVFVLLLVLVSVLAFVWERGGG